MSPIAEEQFRIPNKILPSLVVSRMADPFDNHPRNPVGHVYIPQNRPFSSEPKVGNICVHFVGSDDPSRQKPLAPATVSAAADRKAAAVAIQKAARGFLVRRNVRVVRQIAVEVDEVERNVREDEIKIRMHIKERLRVGEELMTLLLRLDSVRWVRDLRKKIVRRVMGLQDVIDSISAAADGNSSAIDISEDPGGLAGESVEESSMDPQETNEPGMELELEIPAAVETPAGKIDLIVAANGGIPTSVITEESMSEDGTGSPEADISKVGEPSEELRGLKEMMERMAVENETLKMMVTRLCATNAEQCRLMEGLAGRVNNLEHVVHRMDGRKEKEERLRSSAA